MRRTLPFLLVHLGLWILFFLAAATVEVLGERFLLGVALAVGASWLALLAIALDD